MGTNTSKSPSSPNSKADSHLEIGNNGIGEKVSTQHRLVHSLRLPALDLAVVRTLEALLAEKNITEVSLQRHGIREVPEVGILLKPLRLDKMTTLLLDYNQLKAIPDCLALQPQIAKVSLSHNCFSSTPSLGNTLTWLDLSWNSITVVDENVSQLLLLRHLDLRHNRLGPRSLPDLSDLSFLEYLDVSENALTSYPRLASGCLLKVLKVGYNPELVDPADSFGPFPQLELFSCLYTRLKIFPKFLMQSNEHLHTLDMSNTLVSRLPMSLSFPKLERLYLSATKFVPSSETEAEIQDPKWSPPTCITDEVQVSLKGLHNLRTVSRLELDGIGLFHLPDSLFVARPLTLLSLRWNNLFALPDALLALTTLECLDLLGNKLSAIPGDISRLENLRHLSLGHNRLTTLPLEITHLTNLETLVLEHNVWEDPALETLYWNCDDASAIMERLRSGDRTPIIVEPLEKVNELEGSDEEQLKDRVMGLIFGLALGDAVGLCSEFLMHAQATYTCPTHEIDLARMHRDRHRHRWLQGDWTDDTDQAILLVENLLFRCDENGALDLCAFGRDLLQWAEYGFPELGDDGGMGIGQTVARVLRHPLFLSDPKAASAIVWKEGGYAAAANGALMRCAPVSLFGFWTNTPETQESEVIMDGKSIAKVPVIGDTVSSLKKNANVVRQNSLESCLVTHTDPRCIASCLALNMAIVAILRGERDMKTILDIAYTEGKHIFSVPPADKETKNVDKYQEWSDELKAIVYDKTIEQLDLSDATSMGYTYKCLGAAFSVFRTSQSFEKSLIKITSLGGDADTNGAVAGALLGVKVGFKSLPEHWLQSLPHRKWLEHRAEKVWEYISGQLFPKTEPLTPPKGAADL